MGSWHYATGFWVLQTQSPKSGTLVALCCMKGSKQHKKSMLVDVVTGTSALTGSLGLDALRRQPVMRSGRQWDDK